MFRENGDIAHGNASKSSLGQAKAWIDRYFSPSNEPDFVLRIIVGFGRLLRTFSSGSTRSPTMLITKISLSVSAHKFEPNAEYSMPIPMTPGSPAPSSILKNSFRSQPFNHALIVDLYYYNPMRDFAGRDSLGQDADAAHGLLLHQLRSVVAKDIASPFETRIDLICIQEAGGASENKIWKELADLCPRRVEIMAGPFEGCQMESISWPLEGLYALC